jgi:hypothetical protein
MFGSTIENGYKRRLGLVTINAALATLLRRPSILNEACASTWVGPVRDV